MSTFSPPSHLGHDVENAAIGSRLEAATQAIIRARNQVVSTLEQQVAELQQIYRALAYAPAPQVVPEQVSSAVGAVSPVAPLFNMAPQITPPPSQEALSPFAPAAAAEPPPMPRPQTIALRSIVNPPQQSATLPPPRPVVTLPVPRSVPAAPQFLSPPPMHHTALDPSLEQATLDELNDALANAFASVSLR